MVNKENYEEYMLLYADNELSDAEIKALLAFVDANPELRSELEAYKATQLVPDTTIVYANKDALMKSAGGARTIGLGKWWIYAAAACVILFAVIIVTKSDVDTIHNSGVVVKKDANDDRPIIITQQSTKNTLKEEIHSKPVSPVAHENTIAKANSKIKTTNSKSQIPNHKPQAHKQEPVITRKEEPIQHELQPPTQQRPVTQPTPEQPIIAKAETHVNPVIKEPSSANETVSIQGVKEKKNVLALLPVSKEKTEGLNVLANAVNEKIEKIKEVKNNIRDSEVKFRIGNKELFAVRL